MVLKREGWLDFLSPNRTGWGHWMGSLLFFLFYYLFSPGRCDWPVSLWDPLRTGIGSCCSLKSTLSMWEEVLENFSSFSSFLFYLLGLKGKILTDRYWTRCVLQVYYQHICKASYVCLWCACDHSAEVSLQGWGLTPVFNGVTSCHEPFGGLWSACRCHCGTWTGRVPTQFYLVCNLHEAAQPP